MPADPAPARGCARQATEPTSTAASLRSSLLLRPRGGSACSLPLVGLRLALRRLRFVALGPVRKAGRSRCPRGSAALARRGAARGHPHPVLVDRLHGRRRLRSAKIATLRPSPTVPAVCRRRFLEDPRRRLRLAPFWSRAARFAALTCARPNPARQTVSDSPGRRINPQRRCHACHPARRDPTTL